MKIEPILVKAIWRQNRQESKDEVKLFQIISKTFDEMATNSPGQSIHLKSPRSPRQLPKLPPIPISGQRSPTQLPVSKSPGTPLVFEFPPEYYPETSSTNFDCQNFAQANEIGEQLGPRSPRSPRSPGYYALQSSNELLQSSERNSPIFQFCNTRKNLGKTLSYPPKSPVTSAPVLPARSPSSSSYGSRSPKSFDHRRNFCFGPSGPKSPMSPTIVTPSSLYSVSSGKHFDLSLEQKSICRETNAVYKSNGSKSCNVEASFRAQEKFESPKNAKKGGHFNRSQECLDEAGRGAQTGHDSAYDKIERHIARKSTSDLTDIDDAETEVTLLSSPRRRGSMKGGLAYLASRRGSRGSQCSNLSNVSNEDLGPLNFSAHPRGRQRRTSNFLELPVPDHSRPRVHSLPEKAYNPRAGDDLYRLRAFSITRKGLVNQGDSIISRWSRSNTSVNSSRNSNVSGERSQFDGSCCSGQGMADSTESDVEDISKYGVVLLGDSGVGKTALVNQFMTSEYMNTYDTSLDNEFGEKKVSILLDEEESEMVFIDHPYQEMSVENSLSTYEPHACIVVYSIVSRTSFQVAQEILNYLCKESYTQDRSVIVVGNKVDLERSRAISTDEGKKLATSASREYKFIETSSGIQHNVDELLVGVLKQIRLRETREKKLRRQGSKGKISSKLPGSKTVLSLNLAKEILTKTKMCLHNSKSKSCENLHVL